MTHKPNETARAESPFRPMKRLEIVVDTPNLDRLLSRLRDAGVKGYTVLPNASGLGERGTQRGDDPSGVSGNACVLVAIGIEDAPKIIEATRAALRRTGGICLVTDCQWLEY